MRPITILFIALSPILLCAQEYNSSTALTFATQGVLQAQFVNVGGAGYQDILISSFGYNRITWHNGDGEGSFLGENSFEESFADPVLLAVGQMDQNPLDDIIAANAIGQIFYCARLGLDSYAAPMLIATTENDLLDMKLFDLNDDGLQDIVVSEDEYGLIYYPSNGDGTVGPPITIVDLSSGVRSYDFGNFNGGINMDVVFIHDDYGLGWASHGADGTYGPPTLIEPPNDDGYLKVHVPNPDSGSDLLVAARDLGEVLFLSNLDGAFDVPVTLVSDPLVRLVETFDMDGDGDLDLITVNDAAVSVFESLGGGLNYGPAEVIETFDVWFSSLDVKDVDNDGLGELLLGTVDYNGVQYFENEPFHGILEGRVISSDAIGVVGIELADIDGDGDNDIVSASHDDHKVSWYENLSPGVFGGQRYITDRAIDVTDFLVLDFFGDGEQEIMVERKDRFGNPRLAIIDNDGTGQFAYPDDRITFGELYAMASGHLDSDGKEDIVICTASNFGTLYRFKLISETNLASFVIGNVTSEIKNIEIADMNGDSYQDIVISSVGYGMFWYRNQGNGIAYDGPFYFDDTLESFENFSLYDLDQDGDQDILICAVDGGEAQVYWFENSGTGEFTRHNTEQGCLVDTEFSVGDVEGDGDIDFFYRDPVIPYPRLSLNDGNMQFFGSTTLCNGCVTEETNVAVLSEDADGDGDLDAYYVSDDIYYTENKGLICPADINRDGWININDFIIFNSNYGNLCSGYCPSDINSDGIVNVEDFILLNSEYDQGCN